MLAGFYLGVGAADELLQLKDFRRSGDPMNIV
jgi:hypothetical protein